MKAIIYREYGGPEVLTVENVDKPAPNDNEILIRIHATHVNYGDLTARNFKNISAGDFNMPVFMWWPAKLVFGLNKPKNQILGSEFSGVVETTGNQVTLFKEGDQVFGYRGMKMGSYAEYVCMSESGVVAKKPENMDHNQAAAVPYGGIMALNLVKKANIQKGQKVLINGASGAMGSNAVQLAKYYGANVTGVCGNQRMDYVKSLGADHVINYKKEDFTKGRETYDVIIDILGRASFNDCQKVLNKNGLYLLASFKTKQLMQMLKTSVSGDKKVVCALLPDKAEDLNQIKEMVESG